MLEGERVEGFFDRLHEWARSKAILHRFAWLNRILLFLGFFPTGLIKSFGYPFASPRIGEPLYSLFSTLHATGLWWRFIGLCQVVAALLLLTPRVHLLGAIVYFAVLVNIVLITFSMDFHGTEVIVTGMLLANLYLICWDYHRWRSLLPWWTGRAGAPFEEQRPALAEKAFMVLTVAAGALFFDRLNWFNHWVSKETVKTAEYVYWNSGIAMLISFFVYSRRARNQVACQPSSEIART